MLQLKKPMMSFANGMNFGMKHAPRAGSTAYLYIFTTDILFIKNPLAIKSTVHQ